MSISPPRGASPTIPGTATVRAVCPVVREEFPFLSIIGIGGARGHPFPPKENVRPVEIVSSAAGAVKGGRAGTGREAGRPGAVVPVAWAGQRRASERVH